MSILPEVEDLELRPNEAVVEKWLARHEQPHLLVARNLFHGQLILTNQRLAFQPLKMGLAVHAVGVVAGHLAPQGDPWSTELADIGAVLDQGVARPPLSEEKRTLVVERLFGLDTETFIITTSLDGAAEKIRAAVTAVDPASGATREKWSIAANSVQGGTAVGGRLSLVGESLVFLPSGIEKAFDALVGSPLQPILSMLGRDVPTEAREIPLADIEAVENLEGELSLSSALAGGLRDRLRLRTKRGTEEVFVVSDLERTIERIKRCLPKK